MTHIKAGKFVPILMLLAAAGACSKEDVDAQNAGATSVRTPSAGGPSAYPGGGDCTYTQGYWKNHPDAWRVTELRLGNLVYTKAQLLAILKREVDGNGLLALAHQLIAARLNIAAGAASAGIATVLAEADARIGDLVVPPVGTGSLPSSQTSKLNDALTAFNEGKIGPGHCEHGRDGRPPPPPAGGGMTPPPDAARPPPPATQTPPPATQTPPAGNVSPDAGPPPTGGSPDAGGIPPGEVIP